MMKTFLFVLSFFLFSFDAAAINLDIVVSHKLSKGKVYILGTTNLPSGTIIGIKVSASTNGYSAQSYNVFVKVDGSFISEGFSDNGKTLKGKYAIKIITYLNSAWQNKEVLEKLSKFKGYGIENGAMLISHLINIASPNNILAQPTKQKYSSKHKELVQKFCYALQAALICDDLKMRVYTEQKLIKQVGKKLRGSGSPYNKSCLEGLSQAFEDEEKGLCS